MRGSAGFPFSLFAFARFFAITQLPVSAPLFDGKRESFANYAQRVKLWCQVTNLDPANRASALASPMGAIAREVRMAAGSDLIMNHDGVGKILVSLHEYLAPDTVASVYQEVVRFLQSRRAAPTIRWKSWTIRFIAPKS